MGFSIFGSEKVIDFLGYWPKFCDAKLNAFCFNNDDNECSVRVKIFYIDSDSMKSVLVEIIFGDVSDLALNDVLSENVLDELVIDSRNVAASSKYKITLDSCYGVHGNFSCRTVKVVAAQCKMWNGNDGARE